LQGVETKINALENPSEKQVRYWHVPLVICREFAPDFTGTSKTEKFVFEKLACVLTVSASTINGKQTTKVLNPSTQFSFLLKIRIRKTFTCVYWYSSEREQRCNGTIWRTFSLLNSSLRAWWERVLLMCCADRSPLSVFF